MLMRVCRITARLHVLPLVSKRWARIMRTSAAVWQRACIDLSEIVEHIPVADRPGLCPDFAVMATWFHLRQGRIEQLALDCAGRDVHLPPVMTGILLSTQAASLRSLSLDMLACGIRGEELGVVAALQGLTALHVHVGGAGLDGRGMACLRTASRLPALTHLHLISIRCDQVAQEDISLPCCQELYELRSDSLEHLAIEMGSGTEDELWLAGNPNLKDVHLFTPPSSDTFWLSIGSFQGCTAMEQLTLQYQHSLRLQLGCFNSLSALTSLALADCGLLAVPAELAPLLSLYSLDLSQNEGLEIDETGAAVLRTLETMRKLDVAKYNPGVHSITSVQALFDLAESFRDEGLPLHVNFNPALSDVCEAVNAF